MSDCDKDFGKFFEKTIIAGIEAIGAELIPSLSDKKLLKISKDSKKLQKELLEDIEELELDDTEAFEELFDRLRKMVKKEVKKRGLKKKKDKKND